MCSLVHNAVRRQLPQSMSIQCVLQTFKRLQICNALQLNTTRLRQCSLKAEQQTYLTAIHGSSGCLQTRYFSVNARANSKDNGGKKENGPVSLSRSRSDTLGLSAAQKVKAAGRDFTYLIVVIVGVGVTGGLLYVVFKELFSSSSPSKIYGKALEKCRGNPEVIGAFGEPIKGYGETTRRGRRQQVRHVEYIKDGLKHMRLKFYIEGAEPQMKGTVHTEMKEDPETGKYEFRYIFVDVEAYPRRTIVVEDNR